MKFRGGNQKSFQDHHTRNKIVLGKPYVSPCAESGRVQLDLLVQCSIASLRSLQNLFTNIGQYYFYQTATN